MAHIANIIEKIVEKVWKNDKGEWKAQFSTKKWEVANTLIRKMATSFSRAEHVVFVVRADLDLGKVDLSDVGDFCSLEVSVFPAQRFLVTLEQLAIRQRAAESQDLEDFLHSEIASLRDLVEGWVSGYTAAVV